MGETVTDEASDLYASFTVPNAVATLLKAMSGLEIGSADLKMLRSPADNAMIAIPKLGLVARIGVSRSHLQRLARELELAAWLNSRGIPAVQPARDTPTQQLTVIDSRVLTWWEYLPSAAIGSVAELGHLLAQLHGQPRPWPGLPQLDPWARVEKQLAAATGLPDSDLALLREHWDGLRRRWDSSRWPRQPGVAVHGDAYIGNTLRLNNTTYLLDFEDARIGPAQWDAASIAGSLQVGWTSPSEYDMFCNAYGSDVRDQPESQILVDIVLFRRTCWYASRTGREPDVTNNVRHRIRTLADPALTKQWIPG